MKYPRNEFAFYKDDQEWKWDVDNELHPKDIEELAHSCLSGKLLDISRHRLELQRQCYSSHLSQMSTAPTSQATSKSGT